MGAKSNFLGQWKFLFWLSVLLFFHLYIWKKLNTGKQKENEICACGEGWLCHDNSLCLILLSSPSLNILVLWLFFFKICFVLVDQECSQVCPPGLSLRREDFFRAIQLHQLFHMWGSHFPSSLFNAEGQKLEFCSGSFSISNKLKCL